MFPEHRLLHDEFNTLDRIVVEEKWVIIVGKVVLIGQMIVTQFATFPRVNAHRIGHLFQPLEYSVAQSEVADGCRHRDPAQLVDSSCVEVGLDIPVR